MYDKEFYRELNAEQGLQDFPTVSPSKMVGLIIVIDGRGGMAFNNRRQSRDSKIVERIEDIVGLNVLHCSSYTSSLFPLDTDINIITKPPKSGFYYYFPETDFEIDADQVVEIHVFNWNKTYPADVYYNTDFDGWTKVKEEEFKGNSHDKITYTKYKLI